jgi:hypothetical protein
MNKLSLAIVGVVLALTSGCLFGDRFGTGKTVSVRFLPPAGQSTLNLSANGPEVQEALKVMDAVLTPEGLTRGSSPPAQNPNGLVAYYHYSPERPSSCSVFVDGDRLNIVFRERQQRNPSPEVKRMCTSLAEKLKAHFEDRKISVE